MNGGRNNMIGKRDRTKAYNIVSEILPERGKILCLSLTGSRAFGWGSKYYDVDVKGIIACKDYWDTMHIGKEKFDINIEELSHVFGSIEYKYWCLFEDLSNPFYIDPNFDYQGMMSLCTAENVKRSLYSIDLQIKRLDIFKSIRTALHCYRVLMVPLHFLRTGKIVSNVLTINKQYNFTQLKRMCDLYKERKTAPINWDEVQRNLSDLRVELEEELAKRSDTLDQEAYENWRSRMEEAYY